VTEGTKFTVDANLETDDKLVLADDYNSYMFSAINIDGLMRNVFPHKKLLMRKLDQNGSLVDTYTKDYANKTNGVLHNYLGSQQIDDDKFVAFTEEYLEKKTERKFFSMFSAKKTELLRQKVSQNTALNLPTDRELPMFFSQKTENMRPSLMTDLPIKKQKISMMFLSRSQNTFSRLEQRNYL
jgi:hypothetical protein